MCNTKTDWILLLLCGVCNTKAVVSFISNKGCENIVCCKVNWIKTYSYHLVTSVDSEIDELAY